MNDQPAVSAVAAAASVTHTIKPGCEKAYEALMVGINEAARRFPGYQRREVIKTPGADTLRYPVILHFDTEANLRRWADSPERQEWLNRMSGMMVESTPLQVLTGLETWFTLAEAGPMVPPPRYKMMIVTWLAIFPLITAINAIAAPLLDPLPVVVRALLMTSIAVPTMTYLVMPRMTRLFRRWLYPPAADGTAA